MDDLIERCYSLGWTDGLPVVPPTRERVETMAGGRRLREVVAVLEPGRAEATIEKIAANAVMAGCLPAYFPVVVTAVRALADDAFRLDSVLTTVHSEAPLVLINGPVINALGFNAGANVFGSGARANATVGRAVSLVLQNIAGAKPGGLDPATLGHPGKYSYCIAENEHASPWPPFHTERGYAREASTVTVYPADAPLCLACLGAETPDPIIRTIADALPLVGTYTMAFGGDLLIVMSPEHATICQSAGMTKDDVRQAIFDRAKKPAGAIRGLGATAFGDITPQWLVDAADDDLVGPVRAPENLRIVVAGGDMGGCSAVVFGHGAMVTYPIQWEEQ